MSQRSSAAASPHVQLPRQTDVLSKRAFRRLLAPGAELRPPSDQATGFEVFGPRNQFASPLDTIAHSDVLIALASEWLAPASGDGGCLVLTRPAITLLRQALSRPGLPGNVEPAKKTVACETPPAHPLRGNDRILTSPLAWLRRRKDSDGRPWITDALFDAGERLAADFHRGGMHPRTTDNWDAFGSGAGRVQRSGSGAGVEIGDAISAAQERVRRALDAVGPELANVLLDVCCFERGLEAFERDARLPPRSGKVVLRMGLTSLARHYGLIPPDSAWRRVADHWRKGG